MGAPCQQELFMTGRLYRTVAELLTNAETTNTIEMTLRGVLDWAEHTRPLELMSVS